MRFRWTGTTLVAAFGALAMALLAWWFLQDALAAVGAGAGTFAVLKLVEI